MPSPNDDFACELKTLIMRKRPYTELMTSFKNITNQVKSSVLLMFSIYSLIRLIPFQLWINYSEATFLKSFDATYYFDH